MTLSTSSSSGGSGRSWEGSTGEALAEEEAASSSGCKESRSTGEPGQEGAEGLRGAGGRQGEARRASREQRCSARNTFLEEKVEKEAEAMQSIVGRKKSEDVDRKTGRRA
jgi:hypothetical protein